MEFRTVVPIEKPNFCITHTDGICLAGSCFTENIGNYLYNNLFDININPFGIIYNPIALFTTVAQIFENKQYVNEDLLCNKSLYYSFNHHGEFSDVDANKVLNKINTTIKEAHVAYTKSKYIFFTLGTSMVYEHKQTGEIVANCHKLPADLFSKRMLTITEIKAAFLSIIKKLKDKKIIFTVSPVRHWRDGAVENQRSKSILIESIHQLLHEQENCYYFPAYEIVMDELRDYRFYNSDMLHPNEMAIRYIWQRFSETYFTPETIAINNKILKIRQLLQHKVKHTGTKEYADFLNKRTELIADFTQKYPFLKHDF